MQINIVSLDGPSCYFAQREGLVSETRIDCMSGHETSSRSALHAGASFFQCHLPSRDHARHAHVGVASHRLGVSWVEFVLSW